MPAPPIATIVPLVVDTLFGHDELRAYDDVRQGRGQAGEEEPVDRQAGQDCDVEGRAGDLVAHEAPTPSTIAARSRLENTRICRRRHRSSRTPANGPTSE
jgi:hypothetical protein